ncbi:MAG TPA: hypothetical protein VEW93_01260 [Acidimicrobiales bacterium]|nr:hypothetical protein [Acidimicrobiales bacterium]
MRPLSPRTRALALALAGWTLLTWTTRLPLAWGDDALETGEKVLATLPVGAFVALAALAAVAVLRRWDRAGAAVTGLAAWSLGYWLVRLPLIVAHGHRVGFVVVHTALAVVAGALSVLALRGLGRDGSRPRWARVAGPRGATG